jgi:AraC-like DNA-binding protein
MQSEVSTPIAASPTSLDWRGFRDNLTCVEMRVHDDPHDGFRSYLGESQFGGLCIRHVGSSGVAVRCERSQDLIRENPEDLVWICLVLGGDFHLEQQGATAHLGIGDFAMVDARRPYSIWTETADTLWVGAPQDVISRHVWDVDELLGVAIPGAHGSGQMASRVLQAAFGGPPTAPEGEAKRIIRGVFDVLGATVDTFRLDHAKTPYRNAVLRRIKAYVDQHLEDDGLSVSRIARDHGVSPRYLARIFQDEEDTVSGWIWNRRLERCQVALMSASASASISEIAFAHGFKNLSHFSKAFKERYGVPPSTLLRDKPTVTTGDLRRNETHLRASGQPPSRGRWAMAS